MVRHRESWGSWLVGAVVGLLLRLLLATTGPMLLVLVFFVLPLGFVVARSVAYVSGASVGLGVGWLTMPLWHDTPAVTSVAGISIALLAVGVLTGLLAWRRSGLPVT